jgi:hypothetical protein
MPGLAPAVVVAQRCSFHDEIAQYGHSAIRLFDVRPMTAGI